MRPSLFIGSSEESVEVAYELQANLEDCSRPTVWKQGIFDELNQSNLQLLLDTLDRFDFAVFVFGKDDIAKIRGDEVSITRDNVIFEFGLFMGRLGPQRTFFVVPKNQPGLHILTDLLGLTTAYYDSQRDDLMAALGPASSRIRRAIQRAGPLTPKIQSVDRKTVFQCGSDYLKEKCRGDVLIYAPTGVWTPDDPKKEWFKTIAACLVKGREKENKKVKPLPIIKDMKVTTTLGNFIGAYGIPQAPDEEEGTSKEWKEFAEKLDDMEEALLPFNGLDTAHIYRLKVNTETIPGTGVIIIDDSALAICFATTGRYKVDYGIFIRDQKDITNEVRKWFYLHVMEEGTVPDKPIQEMKESKPMKEGMDDIREDYGLPRKHGN